MSDGKDAVLTVRMYDDPRIHLSGDLENVPHVSNFSVHFVDPSTCSVTNKKLLFLWNFLAIFVVCSLFFLSKQEVAMQLESRYVQVSLDQDLWDEFSQWYSGAPILANGSQFGPDELEYGGETSEADDEYDIQDILPSSGDIEWDAIKPNMPDSDNSTRQSASDVVTEIEKSLQELEMVLDPDDFSLANIQETLKALTDSQNQSVWMQFLLDGVHNTLQLINHTSGNLEGLKLHFLPEISSPCWVEVLTPGNKITHSVWGKRIQKRLSWRMRCLPAFFLGGFPKCGTTDLYHRLSRHPAIYAPRSKEPHWWSRKRVGGFPHVNHGEAVPLQSYLHLFDRAAGNMMRDDNLGTALTVDGSASTIWDVPPPPGGPIYYPKDYHVDHSITTAYQISRLLPQPKMVVIVREPVSRVYSDFLFFQSAFINSLPANQSYQDTLRYQVRTQILEIQDCLTRTHHDVIRCAYWIRHNTKARLVRLYVGLYHVHIETWLTYFPRHSIHILQTEDYSKNKIDVLQDTVRFLGLEDYPADVIKSLTNDTRRYRARIRTREPLAVDIAAMLRAFYKPYNIRLAELLNDDKFMW